VNCLPSMAITINNEKVNENQWLRSDAPNSFTGIGLKANEFLLEEHRQDRRESAPLKVVKRLPRGLGLERLREFLGIVTPLRWCCGRASPLLPGTVPIVRTDTEFLCERVYCFGLRATDTLRVKVNGVVSLFARSETVAALLVELQGWSPVVMKGALGMLLALDVERREKAPIDRSAICAYSAQQN